MSQDFKIHSTRKNCFSATFNGLEEWMIPFIKIVATNTGSVLSDAEINYQWINIGTNKYILFFSFYDNLTEEGDSITVSFKYGFLNPKQYLDFQK